MSIKFSELLGTWLSGSYLLVSLEPKVKILERDKAPVPFKDLQISRKIHPFSKHFS